MCYRYSPLTCAQTTVFYIYICSVITIQQKIFKILKIGNVTLTTSPLGTSSIRCIVLDVVAQSKKKRSVHFKFSPVQKLWRGSHNLNVGHVSQTTTHFDLKCYFCRITSLHHSHQIWCL